jgi:hypothetical protein
MWQQLYRDYATLNALAYSIIRSRLGEVISGIR